MSSELQSIPARHGTATFVPKGQTIRIINTYGKQVVDTWLFALPKAPERDEVEQEEEELKEETKAVEAKVEQTEKAKGQVDEKPENVSGKESQIVQEHTHDKDDEGEPSQLKKETEQVLDQTEGKAEIKEVSQLADEKNEGQPEAGPSQKAGWSSYLPSIRARGKQPAKAAGKTEQDKSKSESGSRTWASYFPSGKGFSSYLPSNTKGSLSAFASSHQRDPTKSYAEQFYDFSKTPVGAATLSAATGSSVSSSLYAAYTAYTKLPRSEDDWPPMEYFSAPHTRLETKHIVPKVGDVLLSNLHTPLAKLVEDTSAGLHDTVTPACNAHYYQSIGVQKWEEHGSCAENLVLALNELNEKAGLKGRRAVGADISVNIAPTPLHLFMNTTIKDGELEVGEPQGPKRSHVIFKAERDVVVVMSACPNEKGVMNAGKCMAANFVVEEDTTSAFAKANMNRKPSNAARTSVSGAGSPPKAKAKETSSSKESTDKTKDAPQPAKHNRKDSVAPENGEATKEALKPEKRKPKKLERRNTPASANKNQA